MPILSNKIRVGVLRGGPSLEYDISLMTGASILEHLPSELYYPVDILITKDTKWYESGIEKSPEKILGTVDVVWNALHGVFGEDGTVQMILEKHGVPYTGSGARASALGLNKVSAKKRFIESGLKTPPYAYVLRKDLSRDLIREVYQSVPAPYIVKPASGGSSIGIFRAANLSELEEAIVACSEYDPLILVEEFIDGKEGTCGVIEKWRANDLYALLPTEIRPKNQFFDYHSKYEDGGAEEICPGNFSEAEKEALESVARNAHVALGLDHYSRSDFRIHPKRGVFILEVNTLPGLTKNSLIPKALQALGSNIKEFIHHVLSLSLGSRRSSQG
jgi:D-alanine-D-alanine ligase